MHTATGGERITRPRCAPRRVRSPLGRGIVLTELDRRVLEDIYHLGVVSTPAVLLLRRSHAPASDRPMTHDQRRMTELWRSLLVSRFDPKLAFASGSSAFFWAMETGRAMAFVRLRKTVSQVSEEEWASVRREAAPARERVLALLASRGIPSELADARLEQIARMCMRFLSGEPSGIAHRVLASTVCAILWLGARARGIPVAPILPDGAAVFPTGGDASVRPDCVFGLGETAILLEAETGATPRGKLAEKIAQYTRLLRGGIPAIRAAVGMKNVRRMRVLFHTATRAHAVLTADLVSRQPREVLPFFRITGPRDLSVDSTGEEVLTSEHIRRNLPLRSGVSAYAFLRDRIEAPIFAQVFGRERDHAIVACSPLLAEGA